VSNKEKYNGGECDVGAGNESTLIRQKEGDPYGDEYHSEISTPTRSISGRWRGFALLIRKRRSTSPRRSNRADPSQSQILLRTAVILEDTGAIQGQGKYTRGPGGGWVARPDVRRFEGHEAGLVAERLRQAARPLPELCHWCRNFGPGRESKPLSDHSSASSKRPLALSPGRARAPQVDRVPGSD